MLDPSDAARVDQVTEAIARLLKGQPSPLQVDADAPQDEIRQLAVYMNQLFIEFDHLNAAITALSQGSLTFDSPGRLPAANAVKNLQAALRHLVWQTRQVAEGDFTQRVSFLGDFATSFNSMVEQLTANREALLEQNRLLEVTAITDALTGLTNRRGARERMILELHRAVRAGFAPCVMMMDIDHFKRVNDTWGHEAGDVVLKALAGVLKKNTRFEDVCARWGGEEFLIMAPEKGLEFGLALAERLRARVEENVVEYNSQRIPVTISIGITTYWDAEDLDATVRRADGHLYRAKNAGRNRVCGDLG
ncbi:MAG: GGDEF domain-containing protein [Candidatus Hydrogenedentes bacterium]|nr:GGDEF domain-containing protein [Candidatus Hydrogenedentota bacterium]